MVDNKYTFYEPSPAPQSGGEPAIRQWASRDFERIATAIKDGRSQMLTLDVETELPVKPRTGMVKFFAAGVASATEGLHEYRSTGWTKL